MNFDKGQIYHIYNQGNNRQKIFFERDNYLFFLKKVRAYILPYADILAWCLMPNHFHFMVLVNEVELSAGIWGATSSRAPNSKEKKISLNQSIGIILSSYTKAINKQEKTSGSLFRKRTKAECVNCHKGITPSFYNVNGIARINIQNTEQQYPQICFNYIHDNQVKAGLVKNAIDWEFSSAQDYAGLRGGNLINRKIAKEYLDF